MASEHTGDVESLLRSALRPIEPPEKLSERVEETLSAVTEAAPRSSPPGRALRGRARSLRDPQLGAPRRRDRRRWDRGGGWSWSSSVAGSARRACRGSPISSPRISDQFSEIADQLRNRFD